MTDHIRRESGLEEGLSQPPRTASNRNDHVPTDDNMRDNRSIGDLLKELTTEGRTLAREEVRLAKTEMSEKLDVFQRNLASIGVGVALLVATVILVVESASRGLAMMLENAVGLETAVWLAPLILAVVIGLIGWGLIKKGTTSIKKEGVVPQDTVDTLKRDAKWAERKVKA